jgi:hypothetical protein
VRADALDSAFHTIVGKGDWQYMLQLTQVNEWEIHRYTDPTWEHNQYPASAGEWKYVAGVRDGGQQYLYVDGVPVHDSVTLSDRIMGFPVDETQDVAIGFLPGEGRFWKGMIDEVRMSSTVRSTDWIWLCYMNQKADDALIVFK